MTLQNKEAIDKIINHISIMVLTRDESASEEFLTELQNCVTQLGSLIGDPEYAEIQAPYKELVNNLQKRVIDRILQSADTFVTIANKIASTHGVVDGSSLAADFPVHDDLSPQLHVDLLVEFIEKHLTALDEFEAAILEPGALEENCEDLQRDAKGYIHNLKGDAGSIGLIGIEKACHTVEDLLLEHGIGGLVEQLLSFKEWVANWINSIAEKRAYAEDSDTFCRRFKEGISTGNSVHQGNTGFTSDGEMDNANLDLLAELLAEEKVKETQAEVKEYTIAGDADVFVDFVTEAEDHLAVVETTVLDANGNFDKDAIDTVFRGIHSIKGASSYFKLLEITESAHVTESLLDEVRGGKRKFDQGLGELVLQFIDLQRTLIGQARKAASADGKLVRQPATANYMNQLEVYQKGGAVTAPRTSKSSLPVEVVTQEKEEPQAQSQKGEKLDVKNYVKVETDRLDQLIDSIGEMTIYSSMLIQNCRQLFSDDERLIKVTHQVEKFGRELQHIGMGMRLIPIRGLFQKMSRLVWDVARKIGKDVKFSMEGEDTELDRTIIDKLADPLMHMIRNAIDHGIESPEERAATSKGKAGSIALKAFHSGGNIHIQIVDDGRGLNPEKLIKKAVEKGIISESTKLTDSEAYQLIFAAGFSTAAAVTDISGRGVGMDVVRRNIESMRGRVNIDSQLGFGTTFTIELPLTLAIIDGIEVNVGIERFIIPTLSVVEFMRPSESQLSHTFDKGETFYFRGSYLPVFKLGDIFEVESSFSDPLQGLIVIVETNGEQFALLVDEVLSTLSTVIKSIGEMFTQNQGVSGCAIMPNGDIALILDLRSLLDVARSKDIKNRTQERSLNGNGVAGIAQ